jgi:hypothetical protein
MCNRELIGIHDHGVKVVPSPKGPRPPAAPPRPSATLKSIYPVWYAGSIQAHIDEEIRLADRIEALLSRGAILMAASEAYLDAEGFVDKEAEILKGAIDAWKAETP